MRAKNFLKYSLVFVVFSAGYAAFVYLYRLDLQIEFLQATAQVPSIREFGANGVGRIQDLAGKWGALVGLGIGLLAWLGSLLLLAILKAVRISRFALTNLAVMALVYGGWLALAVVLVYFEKSQSAVGLGIIHYVGKPLHVAAWLALITAALLYLLPLVIRLIPRKEVKGAAPVAAMLIASTLVLSGCSIISDIELMLCETSDDTSHCYQDAAVGAGEPDECSKVTPPKGFAKAGSNPPQDKCYLMIAQNTGDLSVCDKIKEGTGSYTREECILNASVENLNPSGCQKLTGSAKQECIERVGPRITPDQVMDVDKQIALLKEELAKNADPELQKQLAGLEAMRTDMLATMLDLNRESYERQSDPINQGIIEDWATGDIDDKTKTDLIELNDRLRNQGVPLTAEQYKEMKRVLKQRNDPEYDIEQMKSEEILEQGIGEQLGGLVDNIKFWRMNDTAEEKLRDQQLRFYEKMLERQKAIAKNQSKAEQEFWDVTNKILGAAGDKLTDDLKSKIIEETFGDLLESSAAGPTTAILGEAIDEVKRAAKSAEFRGMVRAYNSGMEEELAKHGNNPDAAHAAVVSNLMHDPYTYATGRSFAQYGNLIRNKDCDGSNPHCLNKDVFWKAMKKSYRFQNPGL